MKWIAYNLLFALAFPLMLPGFLARMLRRGGYRARMGDRFALYPKGLFDGAGGPGLVWIHAVSVGEVQVAGQLMREWRRVEPGVRFCFSTTSSTGWKMAAREVAERDVLMYNPLDFPTFVSAALAAVRPRAIVLTESEIWPNLILKAHRRGVPLYLINARVSDRSAPRYRLARWWFGDVFAAFSRIFAQSELDKSRLVAAGAPAGRIEVAGSFKFDVARRNEAKERELAAWLAESGAAGRKILLGGSTWPGEDEMLLGIAKKLKGVALVLAPRHFEKAGQVEANILKAGFSCVRRSTGRRSGEGETVFLADTTGELMGLYGIADAVFVGKSICEHGSQNMIEPCLCGKPTVVGPYTENFRPVMSDLLEAGGIVQAKDAAEIERTVTGWFEKGDGGLGARAKKAVERRKGVVPECTRRIRDDLAAARAARREPCGRGLARTLAGTAATVAAAAAIVAAAVRYSETKTPQGGAAAAADAAKDKTLPKFGALRTAGAYIAMVEKPDATRVLLAGGEAARYRAIFEQTGLKCRVAQADGGEDGPRCDIVFAAGRLEAESLKALAARTGERGVLAWALDVHKMTARDFKKALEDFPCEETHLWMPGERDWLLVGRVVPRQLKMDAVLTFFTRWSVVNEEAEKAGCGSIQELFANYVGTREEIMPAFEAGPLDVPVKPEFFVQKETPEISWILQGDMDADIMESLSREICAMQDVRRDIIKATALIGTDGGEDKALAVWAEAMKRNPHDTMLLDRLYVMAVNARAFKQVGNIAAAAQCYEAMVAVRPTDIQVVEEYAGCLAMLGKKDLAARVMEKAKEMKSDVDGKVQE